MRFQQTLLEFGDLVHSLTPLGKTFFVLGLLMIGVLVGGLVVWIAGV